MEKESTERAWQKFKKTVEQRKDIQARILWDNMECLILQRELLDKLIEFKERLEKLYSLSEPPVPADPEKELSLEQKIFYDRKCCQIQREVIFTAFIQNVFCSFLNPISRSSPESREENLNMVFTFMECYNGFLKQEYDWVQASIAETNPPEE